MLAEHRLYLETEYHEGHRANFSSADLTGRDFSGLDLRGVKMDRALLRRADFTGAHLQSANLIGAILQEACFDRADLSRARLSGANLVSSSLEHACLARAEMEFALAANLTIFSPSPPSLVAWPGRNGFCRQCPPGHTMSHWDRGKRRPQLHAVKRPERDRVPA